MKAYESAYLISIVVRRSYFDSCRKVEDYAIYARPSLAPCGLDSFTNLKRKLQFCLRKCFRAVFITEFHPV
jgi:hypothetical protein